MIEDLSRQGQESVGIRNVDEKESAGAGSFLHMSHYAYQALWVDALTDEIG